MSICFTLCSSQEVSAVFRPESRLKLGMDRTPCLLVFCILVHANHIFALQGQISFILLPTISEWSVRSDALGESEKLCKTGAMSFPGVKRPDLCDPTLDPSLRNHKMLVLAIECFVHPLAVDLVSDAEPQASRTSTMLEFCDACDGQIWAEFLANLCLTQRPVDLQKFWVFHFDSSTTTTAISTFCQ